MVALIQSVPLMVFVAMVAVPTAIAGVALYTGFRAQRRASLIKGIRTSKIHSAQDGYHEIEGRVRSLGNLPVTSPLTRSPCVWYHALIEESMRSHEDGDMEGVWQVVEETTSGTPFLLSDDSGECLVFPNGADVTPTDRSLWYGSTPRPEDLNPPKLPPGAMSRPVFEVQTGPDSQFRYSEDRIYDGDSLLVLGLFSNKSAKRAQPDIEDPETAAMAAAGTTRSIRRSADGNRPFIMTTTPHDAHIAMMSLGGSAAYSVALVPLAIAALLVWARFF